MVFLRPSPRVVSNDWNSLKSPIRVFALYASFSFGSFIPPKKVGNVKKLKREDNVILD